MPHLQETLKTKNNEKVFVWACDVCKKFTSRDIDSETAFNTVSVHEVGHNFGKDDSIAFPKRIADWKYRNNQ